MPNAVTIINSRGGGRHDLPGRVRAALAKAGIGGEIAVLPGRDCARRAAEAVESGAGLVIAAGGDGTVGAVAGALADSDAALGILPLGTLNHFARDLGVPLGLDEAAALIANGARRRVDLAEMNGRAFVNNSAIGLYPLMVLDRDAQRRRLGRSKRLALAIASLRTLARFRHERLTLAVNDQQAVVDTPLLFVGNNDYRLAVPGAGRRDRLDDGQLCVLVLRKKSRLSFLAASARALAGRPRDDDMVRLDGVRRLRVGSHRSLLTVSIDGEVARLAPPLDYRVRPGALQVVAPA